MGLVAPSSEQGYKALIARSASAVHTPDTRPGTLPHSARALARKGNGGPRAYSGLAADLPRAPPGDCRAQRQTLYYRGIQFSRPALASSGCRSSKPAPWGPRVPDPKTFGPRSPPTHARPSGKLSPLLPPYRGSPAQKNYISHFWCPGGPGNHHGITHREEGAGPRLRFPQCSRATARRGARAACRKQ